MKEWVIPAAGADFARAMEDVLEAYARPYDEKHPVVCFDESPKQLVSEARAPYMGADGVKYEDSGYKREGVAEIFMIVEPLGGRREVSVEENHAGDTWARKMAYIAEDMYPAAERITLVMDNLSAHKRYNLYNVFEPARARAVLDKIDFVFTPKHGFWLNIAECGLSVLSRQALDGRFATRQEVALQVASWANERNNRQKGVDWQFKTKDARIKLKRLYPTVIS